MGLQAHVRPARETRAVRPSQKPRGFHPPYLTRNFKIDGLLLCPGQGNCILRARLDAKATCLASFGIDEQCLLPLVSETFDFPLETQT